MAALVVKGPFESRKASLSLRDQLIAYLVDAGLKPGVPFYSDAELMELSGLSRKTVRKALTDLQQEGWIERQQGRGSFVGPRMAVPALARPRDGGSAPPVVRLAVLVYCMDGKLADWYSQEVLSGLDQSAIDEGISIELLGNYTQDVQQLSRRLVQSRPDVLLVMPATSRHAYMAGEAQRLDIPCVLTGTRLLDLNLPTACEDNLQGASLAVRHLFEKGHRRIGLLQRSDSASWVFERREGYLKGLRECGLEPDERLVWWAPEHEGAEAASLKAYLDQHRPSAVVSSSGDHAQAVGQLLRAGELRVPEDLSIVTFDQHYDMYERCLGVKPTVIELPLQEMGRCVAQIARQIAGGEDASEQVRLPCRLVEGDSVFDLAGLLPQ